jgi:hypothetical protein
MNDGELVGKMLQRLGAEIKGLMVESRQGRVPVAALEAVVRQKLGILGRRRWAFCWSPGIPRWRRRFA